MTPEKNINSIEQTEQPSDQEIVEAWKETGKQLKEQTTSQAIQELSETGKEIVNDINLD